MNTITCTLCKRPIKGAPKLLEIWDGDRSPLCPDADDCRREAAYRQDIIGSHIAVARAPGVKGKSTTAHVQAAHQLLSG